MKVLIGLPAYNEEEGIKKVLASIRDLRESSKYEIRVLVVEDGSTDGTALVVEKAALSEEYIVLLKHQRNLGLGEAVKSILRYAIEELESEDILVTLDADNTHSPHLIERMIDRLLQEDLDLVVASRFTEGGREIGLTLLRKVYSRGAMLYFKMFFPIVHLNDYSSGFRAYRVGTLKKALIRWDSLVTTNGFDCMAEIAAKFSKMKVKAGEVPLILNYHLKQGESKMRVMRTVRGYFSLLAKVR
ncbi:glycosyl transferase family 2 [Syntrophobotulus glycolicus DSM 8271]|uniref:Glycosyl transferase family 2 n=1 Tax=Syntrophobotulus glycolicus (strain DSM 8271 / FlGlyR) TaxID=645991 RepID=F0SVY3_SYNGF|nr:glycosyltransferase family 2 protein [Syntrophobotulus glycolicus]ADY56767.1 glycosyl transferase family 2 [Syntrophobotulus glycolicus DSM 8271]